MMESMLANHICIEKAVFCWIVIPIAQIIQSRLLVEHIPPIPERVALAQRIRQGASGARQLAPCIVLVFYHEDSGNVNDSHDVPLKIVEVGVHRAIEFNLCRATLRVVEEVQLAGGNWWSRVTSPAGQSSACAGYRKARRWNAAGNDIFTIWVRYVFFAQVNERFPEYMRLR